MIHALLRTVTPGNVACAGFNPKHDVKRSMTIHTVSKIGSTLSVAVPIKANVRHHVICIRLRRNTSFGAIRTTVGSSPCFMGSRARMGRIPYISSLGSMNRNIGLIHGKMSNGARGRLFRFSVGVGGPTLATRILIYITHTSVGRRPKYCAVVRIPMVSLLYNSHRRLVTRLMWENFLGGGSVLGVSSLFCSKRRVFLFPLYSWAGG